MRLIMQRCMLEKGYCRVTDIETEINFVNYPKINGDIICLTSVMKVRQLLQISRDMYVSVTSLAKHDKLIKGLRTL